jgi:hypothetical protein
MDITYLKKMCEVESYIANDNTVYLENYTSERDATMKKMNELLDLKHYTCPVTMEQLWKEIENPHISTGTDDIYNIALRCGTPRTYDHITYVDERELLDRRLTEDNRECIHLERYGHALLGLTCSESCNVDLVIGGKYVFTKECEKGTTLFGKYDTVPLAALSYHMVELVAPPGVVKSVIYGTFMVGDIKDQFVEYYTSSENGTRYTARSGMLVH